MLKPYKILTVKDSCVSGALFQVKKQASMIKDYVIAFK